MNPTQYHGAFSWCELMTTDTSAAKDFYSQLFGWRMEDQPLQGITYTVVNSPFAYFFSIIVKLTP